MKHPLAPRCQTTLLTALATLLCCSGQLKAQITVPGTANPWLAGHPNGTTAAAGDSAPAQSPVLVAGLTLTPGAAVTFGVTGSVHYAGTPIHTPDGDPGTYRNLYHLFNSSNGGLENGIAGINAPANSLIGVFLNDQVPVQPSQAPPFLDFSEQAGQPDPRDYTSLSPQLAQPFFIGDGKTSSGVRQQIIVPSGATRLFLGTMDGEGWYNNEGSFSVRINPPPPGPTPTPAPEPPVWVAGRDLAQHEHAVVSEHNIGGTNLVFPQWSYGFRSTVNGTDFTPFTAQQHTDAEQDRSAVQGWASSSGVVLVNTGSQPEQYFAAGKGYQLFPEQILLRRVSPTLPLPVVRWTAPSAGSYRVLAKWLDLRATHNGGVAHVLVNGTQVFGQVENGAFVGQEWGNEGNAAMPTKTFSLNAGDVIDFVLSTRGLDSATEDTAFNAAIVRVPTVTITTPASGTDVAANNAVVSVAVSHHYDISSVALRINGENASVPADTSAPFQFTLPGLSPGIYNIAAVAIDEFGVESLSAPVQVVVRKSGASLANRSANGKDETSSIKTATSGRTFRCTQSGSWNDPATWGNEGVPGQFDDAIISAGFTVDLTERHDVEGLDVAGALVANDSTFNPTLHIHGTMLARACQLGGPGLPGFIIEPSGKLVLVNGMTQVLGGYFFNSGKTVIGENGSFIAGSSDVQTTGTFQMRRTPGSNQPVLARVHQMSVNGGQLLLDSYSHLITDNGAGLLSDNGSGLIGDAGSGLLNDDGSALVGNNGNALIGMDGSSLIGPDGSSLIGMDGSSLIGNAGGTLIGNAGGTLIGTDGSSLVAAGAGNAAGGSPQAAAGKLTSESGQAPIENGMFVLGGGTVSGNIRFTGDVHNTGAFLSPGNSAGLIRVIGNYVQEQNATLILEVAGTLNRQIDHFNITGTATLGGNLIVKTATSFNPPPGQTFTPMSYGAVNGQFGNVTSNAQVAFGLNGMTMQVSGPNPPAPKALNIATRMRVETGDNVLIAGFIITGSQPKKVIVRGIGPSLPFSGVLADPTLSLDNGAITNDNWRSAQEQEIIATSIPPANNLESAIVATLNPGAHTAILAGAGGATGIGVIEVYDLDSGAPTQLANISSRGFVQSGDNVMIGGFIIGGSYPAKVIVRAIGPSLPFPGVLQNPTLELVDSNGSRVTNDNWRETQEAEIVATTIPPTHDREAAIVATLVPGAYTAVVRGKEDTTGIAVVEGYTLQ